MTTKIYMVGLPETGKTTFLGALGHYIISDDDRKGTYVIDRVEDMDYIRKLGEIWAQCQIMERTHIDDFLDNKLLLRDKNGNKLELWIPDQSGEIFEKNIIERTLKESMYRDLQDCDMILMFINFTIMRKNILIPDISKEYRGLEQTDFGEIKKFTIQDQAKYVLMLQDIYDARKKKIRIKMILSAWDKHMGENISPEELLQKEAPLLWQFLESNKQMFESEYWGVSAQGGDLAIKEEREELQKKINAIERIIVVDNEKKETNDITTLLQ